MVNVFFTVDTEIWCGGWEGIDRKFPDAFTSYIYGPTGKGNYALPITFDILNNYGLIGSFFVEPLFSARFGAAPLQEIVGLILDAGHEVQLHLHVEWVDEAREPLLPDVTNKFPNLRYCNKQQQCQLIGIGLLMLQEAGASNINAFRAGSFSANNDTLAAVKHNGLLIDSSYNIACPLGVADLSPSVHLLQPARIGGIYEYPISVFRDFSRRGLRHLQLTACSYYEFEYTLMKIAEAGWDSAIIFSHNFELLTPAKNRADPIVVNRFKRLCRFLDRNRDSFTVRGFFDLEPKSVDPQPSIPESSRLLTGWRMVEQLARRFVR